MKILAISILMLLPTLSLALSDSELSFKYQKILANGFIPRAPLLRLLGYFEDHQDSINNKDYLTFVDFSLDSVEPRLYVIDMRDGHADKYLVAHGKGSDPKGTGKARKFSNIEDSYTSSLGIYQTTDDTFQGDNGYSLRLEGLEKTNDNAFDRGILIHGADYVTPDLHPLGRSEGCFAVERRFASELIDKLRKGSLLMAWIDPALVPHSFWDWLGL